MAAKDIIAHFDVSASALTAERARMRLIASNIANMHTTRTPEGGPYKRQFAVLETDKKLSEGLNHGVRVKEIRQDAAPARLVFDPQHPDADNDGYVSYPNVDMLQEVTDMKEATMAYQANLTVINATKQIISRSLDIRS